MSKNILDNIVIRQVNELVNPDGTKRWVIFRKNGEVMNDCAGKGFSTYEKAYAQATGKKAPKVKPSYTFQ